MSTSCTGDCAGSWRAGGWKGTFHRVRACKVLVDDSKERVGDAPTFIVERLLCAFVLLLTGTAPHARESGEFDDLPSASSCVHSIFHIDRICGEPLDFAILLPPSLPPFFLSFLFYL